MSLSLYMGRAGTGKTTACFEDIKKLGQTDPRAPIVLLVPDPVAYHMERQLAEYMGEGFLSVRVVGFSRLAYQVLQNGRQSKVETLSDVGRNLVLRNILKKRETSLSIFRRASTQPHFADVVKGLITECDAFLVHSSDLYEGVQRLATENQAGTLVLQHKLGDLATIMSDYETILKERFGTTEDDMDRVIAMLRTSPIVKDGYVFIDGFHWFTPKQLALVEALVKGSKKTVMTMTVGADEIESYRRPGTLFHRSWETYHELCNLLGVAEIPIVPFSTSFRGKTKGLQDLERKFFTTPSEKTEGQAEVELFNAYHREREVDGICRKIWSLMETGRSDGRPYRWKDFAILMRESETYGDLMEKALERYEIPYFTDRRHPMVSHPLAELMEGLFEIAQNGCQHDSLFRVLKTDLFPLSRTAVDELENYCLEFGVRGYMWFRQEPWEWIGRSTNAYIKSEESLGREAMSNESIEIIQELLLPFLTFSKEKHRGSEWSDALYGLLMALDIPKTLSNWFTQELEEHNRTESAAHVQMYKRVIELLDEVVLASGDELLSAEEVSLLFVEGLEDMTYSLVPPTLDHVLVTTIERSYAVEFPVVFIPGLNDGVFPKRMGDEGVLRDAERHILREHGISLAVGALGQAFNENFLFYLACTRALEKLILSYASSDEEGKTIEPALFVRRMTELGYSKKGQPWPLTIPDGQEMAYIWQTQQSVSLLPSQLGRLNGGETIAPIWWQLHDWVGANRPAELERALRGLLHRNVVPLIPSDLVNILLTTERSAPRGGSEYTLTGSVTRIEKYQKCPFSFYAEYGLQLRERPIRQFGAPEMGTFLHENLRVLGTRLLENEMQWRDIPQEEQDRLCKEVANEVLSDMESTVMEDSASRAYMLARLQGTLQQTVRRLVKWSGRSTFTTVALEQDFGRTATGWDPLRIDIDDNHRWRLQGQIDRLDWYHAPSAAIGEKGKDYVMIIDYKSGQASIDASAIYYGLKLQLITYLLAVEQAGEKHRIPHVKGPAEPAALVYSYVKEESLTSPSPIDIDTARTLVLQAEDVKNDGYYIDDVDILEEIDGEFKGGATPYVPIRRKKNGEFYGTSMPKIKTKREFSVLNTYVQNLIKRAGVHILEGEFPISPYQLGNSSPCGYCAYKALCRFEIGQKDTTYRYLRKDKDEEVMKRIQEGGDEVYEMDSSTTSGN